MTSWVRYSIAVYMGLLISGALARPPWQAPEPEPATTPSVYHDTSAPAQPHPAAPKPPTHAEVSV